MLTAEEYFCEKLHHSKEEFEFLKKLLIEEEKKKHIYWQPGNASIPD